MPEDIRPPFAKTMTAIEKLIAMAPERELAAFAVEERNELEMLLPDDRAKIMDYALHGWIVANALIRIESGDE